MPCWRGLVVSLGLAALLALGLVPPLPAMSAGAQTSTVEGVPERRPALRERLFMQLAGTRTEVEGRVAEFEIWQMWMRAPDAEGAAAMNEAVTRMSAGEHEAAIAILDSLIARLPDWAEAWNKRATVRYLAGDYAGSLADIDETLKREPKHFGALGGKALILLRQGRDGEAKTVIREATNLHPYFGLRALLDLDRPKNAPGRDI